MKNQNFNPEWFANNCVKGSEDKCFVSTERLGKLSEYIEKNNLKIYSHKCHACGKEWYLFCPSCLTSISGKKPE